MGKRMIGHSVTMILNTVWTLSPGSLPFFFAGPVRTRSMTVSWTFQHISNASMEGFNNKIRWLIKQVYGFRTVRNENNRLLRMPQIKNDFTDHSF